MTNRSDTPTNSDTPVMATYPRHRKLTHKISTALSKLGEHLAINQAAYPAVDIQKSDFGVDAFHAQGGQAFRLLFGHKGTSVQTLALKFIPKPELDKGSDWLFDQVANLARRWADFAITRDERFGQLHIMDDDAKQAFAKDFANAQRTLATMGGMTASLGLKGVVLDMAWLLMVSLKTVFGLAMIYQQPLTGRHGLTIAFGILSTARLEHLHEKQVLLTALAMAHNVLENAYETGLASELDTLGKQHQSMQIYTKQLADLGNYFDIDKLNPSWLHRLLPLVTTGAGVYYNRMLIDEVIGTAMATFAQKSQIKHIETPKILD
ncbi:EcsC family protein [Moraxella pluranimalium]|uniref:EcsC family protein n=1 Tax=Moraxella pluranimalium TaxID=470453 RepID=A0A1T0CPF5_9GAMM|nr:EcsC family protein [Moraxella pluranimalium]OOS24139.1 hypothetical protein B0680_04965 [Moraxella pluranimalium]